MEGIEVLYSKSEQTSFTPPLLVSFTDRDLSVPKMWVCVHKDTQKLHLSLFLSNPHTLVPVCEWAALCAQHGKPRQRGAGRAAGSASSMRVGSWLRRNIFRVPASMCNTTVAYRLCFSMYMLKLALYTVQFQFCCLAQIQERLAYGNARWQTGEQHTDFNCVWHPPTGKATQHIKVIMRTTQL